MRHAARVFADEIRLDFLYRFGAGQRPALRDGLAQTHDAGVRMDFKKQPAWLHQERFQFGDFYIVPGGNGSVLAGTLLRGGFRTAERREAGAGERAANDGTAIDGL